MSDQPTDPGPTGQPPGGRTPPPSQDQPSAADAKGFFSALFDLSFNRFITPMIIKFVYVLMMVGIVIVYLFYAIVLFRADNSIGVLWLLVIGPIASVLWLAIARMTLEFYLAVVRVSEDVHSAIGRGGR